MSLPRVDLDDQDAGSPGRLGVLGQAERHPQIVDRHHVAAEVDHAQQEFRAAGHFGQGLHVQDFLDAHDLQGIALSPESEDDEGLGAIAVGFHAGVRDDIDHHPTFTYGRSEEVDTTAGPVRSRSHPLEPEPCRRVRP